jgi:predicted CoA-binding protein
MDQRTTPGELPEILDLALELRARAIWLQSDRSAEEIERARHLIEGVGLVFISEPYIADGVRARGS